MDMSKEGKFIFRILNVRLRPGAVIEHLQNQGAIQTERVPTAGYMSASLAQYYIGRYLMQRYN